MANVSSGTVHNRSVLDPLRHLGSGLAYLATARRMQASDHATARQLAWPPGGSPLPPGLELTWIGTAGFRLAYQGVVAWIEVRAASRDLPVRVLPLGAPV